MEKYTDKQIEGVRDWLIHSKGSIFGIIYKDMIKNNKDPYGKDIDELFSRAEGLRDATTKNSIIKTLYKDVINLQERE